MYPYLYHNSRIPLLFYRHLFRCLSGGARGNCDIQPHSIISSSPILIEYIPLHQYHFLLFQWNKFHCINIGRAYGTGFMHLISSVGTTDIDAQGFNPEQ